MCQQEEEPSLVNVLGENVDKMQLTRRILDLKQVRAKELLTITRNTVYLRKHILEITLYTFPCVAALYYIFFPRGFQVIYLWRECNLSFRVYGKDRWGHSWTVFLCFSAGWAALQKPPRGDQPLGSEAGETGEDRWQKHLHPEETHQ